MSERPVIISACLMGLMTRHDGGASFDAEALEEAGPLPIPVCPEQLGGLPTPRRPALIKGGSGEDVLKGRARVMDMDGMDGTEHFLRGAEAVGEIARRTGARRAVLKEKSPSCGVRFIYRGGAVSRGMGITTALLREMGIEIIGF